MKNKSILIALFAIIIIGISAKSKADLSQSEKDCVIKMEGIAEFIAGKSRDNETGTIRLVSNLKQSRFENHTGNYQSNDYD